MVEQFPKVFAPPTGMPPVRNVEHVIELEPGKKIPRPRRVPRFSLAGLETISAWFNQVERHVAARLAGAVTVALGRANLVCTQARWWSTSGSRHASAQFSNQEGYHALATV